MSVRKNRLALAGLLTLLLLSALFVPPLSARSEGQGREEKEEGKDSHRGGQDQHGAHEDEEIVALTDAEMKEFGVVLSVVGPGKLEIHVALPAEIALNADRLVHVVPRVPGIVREVRKTLGDSVRRGEVLAVLDSRELADAKAAFLAARERAELAEANFNRELALWQKKIAAEQEYLEAKRMLAEARIEVRLAEQKLHALGFSEDYLARLPTAPDVSYTRYELVAPMDATVIGKHMVLGEVLKDDSEAFVLADLSTVWVDISVYQKDLALIRKGMDVVISAGHRAKDGSGAIIYIGPMVGETTRTAIARVVLPNEAGQWRPGMFVTAKVTVQSIVVPVLIPKTALQTYEDETVVFIETEEGLSPQPVEVGRENGSHAEILSGLPKGKRYVSGGAFTLKAQLSKGGFGDGHNH